ncbi:MAG: hypothetical protein R3B57_00650 [Phycisphaerales bacterium]
MRTATILLLALLVPPSCAQTPKAPSQPADPAPERTEIEAQAPEQKKEAVLAYFDEMADKLAPLVESKLAKEFLAETRALPSIEPFKIYVLPGSVPEGVTEAQYATLPEEGRQPLRPMMIQSQRYYQTIYGPPLTYARPLDLVGTVGGWDTLEGKKILDFGYGQIGQDRLMAQCGADVVGTDVASLLAALYERESDVQVTGSTGKTGSMKLYQARWPAGDRAINLVGEGYDLFIARDVLRMGRMDPQADLEPAHRVSLGVYPDYFLSHLNRIMNTGGLVMIYNTGRYPPLDWGDLSLGADIRSPFSPEQWKDAGFELIKLDENDDEMMRQHAYALGLDKGKDAIDPERHVFVRYTLARKIRDLPEHDAGKKPQDDKDVPRTPWGTPIRGNSGG